MTWRAHRNRPRSTAVAANGGHDVSVGARCRYCRAAVGTARFGRAKSAEAVVWLDARFTIDQSVRTCQGIRRASATVAFRIRVASTTIRVRFAGVGHYAAEAMISVGTAGTIVPVAIRVAGFFRCDAAIAGEAPRIVCAADFTCIAA